MARRNTFEVDETLESPFSFKHLKRAMKYIGRHKGKMGLALLLSAVASVVALFQPKIMQWVLDDAVPGKNVTLLLWLALAYVGIILVSILFSTIRSRIMAHVSQEIIYDIRKDLFAHLQRLPFSYYDSRPAGKILVRVINYVNSVSDMLSNGIINSILEILNILFIVVFMYATNAVLATIIVAAACRKAWMGAVYISNSVWLSSELITQIVFTLLYIAGVYWLGGAIVSFGVILAMGQYVSRFWQPITNLANIYNSFVNNIAYLERIFETMDEPVVVDDAPNAVELPPITGEVEFRDVTFAYEPEVHILENLNLHVKAGESIALVGPTGAGKTTVVNLISRFYNLTGGEILLYGRPEEGENAVAWSKGYDISRVTLHSLRTQMGIMLQDSFIFSGTIRDNIRYGRLDATDEEIEQAAKMVRAHDFIMEMEKGYDTEVNERGSRLSQGQKQLIAFARTLLSDPKILILDEATSSIDTKTERLLQEGIQVLLRGRTSFIIAHRLSTIKTCDRILYIGNKGILEQGSHGELLGKRGLYYDLYTAQAREQGALGVS